MDRVSDAEDKQAVHSCEYLRLARSETMRLGLAVVGLMTRLSWSISGRNVIQVMLRELRLWNCKHEER